MIDPKLQAELRARFNPDGSLLRRHQLRMLEMLKYIDRVCRENDISYWLSSGTCLGAVRHEGFIPWDDDADIEMLRPDYDRLVKILEKDPVYDLQTKKTDPYFIWPYAKLRDRNSIIAETLKRDVNYKFNGIYIDIFVLEPSHAFPARFFGVWGWRVLCLGSLSNTSLKRFLFRIIRRAYFIMISIARLLERFIPGKKLRHTLGVGFAKSIRDEKRILPTATAIFEGHAFSVPADTDFYLRQLYGDYMQLPDINKLHKHTTRIVFSK